MKMHLKFCLAVFFVAAFSPLSQTQSASTVLDYEGFPDSTVLISQVPGVTFANAVVLTSGVSLNEFEFPPHSGLNVVSDNGGPLTITFATPATFVSGYFTYGAALTMNAYDTNGAIVATSVSGFSNNEALSGAMGSTPNELISVASPGGIARVTITGAAGGGSFAMDDTTVMPPIVVMPTQPTPPGAPLTITSALTVPTIPIGGSFTETLTAQGGTPPYSWSSPAALPAGITLSSGGQVGGTPPQPGDYRFVITVTDAVNATQSLYLNYSVLGITTTSLPDAVDFAPYSATVVAVGGTLPYSFLATGLPNGINIGSQGVISGVTAQRPTMLKTTIQVADATGVATMVTLNIAVDPPAALVVPNTTLAAGTVGVPYSQPLVAMNGGPPYSWSLVSGALPAGLVFDPSGVISGVPTVAGNYSFNTKVSDIYGSSLAATLSMTINPPALTVNSAPILSSGMVGVDYPVQLVTASGGTRPYTFLLASGPLSPVPGLMPPGITLNADGSISGTPTTAGSYSFVVSASDSAGKSANVSLSATIRPFANSLILSTGSLNFAVAAGSAQLPVGQTVAVQSTAAASVLAYSVAVSPAVPWLNVTQLGTATPTPFTVALTSAAAALPASATPYQTTVVATCTAPQPCVGITQTLAVSLTVNSAPAQLTISNPPLSFTVSATSPQKSSTVLTLQNAGGSTVAINSIKTGAAWLTASATSATLTSGQQAAVSVTANPAGLSAGYYRSTVSITGNTGMTVIPATLYIASIPAIVLSSGGTQFRFGAGGVPAVTNGSFLVSIASAFAADMPSVSWSASVLPGAAWLSTPTASGNATSATPGTVTFMIDPGIAASLAAGVYYGTIRVSANSVNDAPLDFQVALNVGGTGTAIPGQDGLLFVTTVGQNPAPQTVPVYSTSGGAAAYQAGAASNSLQWLSVSPYTGMAGASAPAQSTVSVSTAGLAAGVYYGGVSYAGAAAAVRTVNVTLIVLPAGTCTPSQLVPARVGLPDSFSIAALRPAGLGIQLLNDCGMPVAGGQVIAGFSNGDAPIALSLVNPATGLYGGTWSPRQPAESVVATLTATAAGLAGAVVQYSGMVLPNASGPSLAPMSTLHVFNPVPGAAVAPGTIVQIYGSNLSSTTSTASGVPLSGLLGGTSVTIGGIAAPLFFVSPGQVNAQAPFELATEGQYQVVVNNNGVLSTPDSVHLSAVAPGIATQAGGLVIAQHPNGSLVSEQSPAMPGEAIVIYAAGFGATDTAVASGAPSPSSPLARPLSALSVTINSEAAQIQFGGLTPGLVGLYQVNLTVPSDAANGDLPLVLSQGGTAANSVILPVHM